MIVSAWHDGHGGYGLRVPAGEVGLYFRPEWDSVTIHLPGEAQPAVVPITECFWKQSPELRSPRIKKFLARNGFVPWPHSEPPHFDLRPLGGGAFQLDWLKHPTGQLSLELDT